MLEAINVSPGKIEFYETKGSAEESWNEILEASQNKAI
jgi:hypothetical protein